MSTKTSFKSLRILSPLHTSPNVKSVHTMFFDNVLPELRKRANVKMIWLVYESQKKNRISKKSDTIILDIHDFNDAIEIIKNTKPDIVFAHAGIAHIHYAISLAAKFFNIPVISGFHGNTMLGESTAKSFRSSALRLFESSIPTDSEKTEKQFLKRGRFFIYKTIFVYKTLKATKLSFLECFKRMGILLKGYYTVIKNPHNPHYSNTIHWLENENLKRKLINKGFDSSSLIVTGNPIHDLTVKRLNQLKKHEKTDEIIRVLLISSPLVEHGIWTRGQRDQVIKTIGEKISQSNNTIKLEIKIHPSTEKLEEYTSITEKIDPEIIVHQKGDVIDYIEKCDVVLCFSSLTSAVISALLIKKPIVICNFYDLENDQFYKRGIASGCKNPETIISTIKQVYSSNPATSEKIDEFIREFMYKADGHASERICDIILNCLKK